MPLSVKVVGNSSPQPPGFDNLVILSQHLNGIKVKKYFFKNKNAWNCVACFYSTSKPTISGGGETLINRG